MSRTFDLGYKVEGFTHQKEGMKRKVLVVDRVSTMVDAKVVSTNKSHPEMHLTKRCLD